MTQREIIERNVAIALFMGLEEFDLEGDDGFVFDPPIVVKGQEQSFFLWRELEYHKDWNWLMPVIERVGNIEKYPREIAEGDWLLYRFDLSAWVMFITMHLIQEDNWSRAIKTYEGRVGKAETKTLILAYWKAISDFCIDWCKSKKHTYK